MNIYIDESGLFSHLNAGDNVENGWATVGALVVPQKSESELGVALEELKRSIGLNNDQEIKRNRPDCSKPHFSNFIKRVKELGCTLYAIVINRQTISESVAIKLKEELVEAMRNYCIKMAEYNEQEKQSELLKEASLQYEMISSLSNAEFIQMRTQTFLYTFMLFNAFAYYAKNAPEELQHITFINDQKNPSFEEAFKKLFPQYAEVAFSKEPSIMMGGNGFDYSYFFQNYGISSDKTELNEDAERKKNIFGVDYSNIDHIAKPGYSILKIFEDMRFEDSQKSVGLQAADLLISNINRTLKGHCDSIDVQAETLGGITVNTPSENMPNIPVLIFDNTILEQVDIKLDALEKMSKFSYPLYNDIFRKNFSKTMSDINRKLRCAN
ncbi:DUF3800 domain-containing protein [Providencia rettgeri]|uniref:DUF3800 domain-containing protein n=1 Tax=Providencia rettgeri TaxID=587 RepID=UPI001182923D|nr:DUF3800 domain-containing protein [Providencia rettgeri]